MFACGLDRTRKGFREPRAPPGTCFYAEFALSGAKKQVALLCKTQRLVLDGTFTQLQPPRLSPHMHPLLKTLRTPSVEKLLRGMATNAMTLCECRWFTAEKEEIRFAAEFAANRGTSRERGAAWWAERRQRRSASRPCATIAQTVLAGASDGMDDEMRAHAFLARRVAGVLTHVFAHPRQMLPALAALQCRMRSGGRQAQGQRPGGCWFSFWTVWQGCWSLVARAVVPGRGGSRMYGAQLVCDECRGPAIVAARASAVAALDRLRRHICPLCRFLPPRSHHAPRAPAAATRTRDVRRVRADGGMGAKRCAGRGKEGHVRDLGSADVQRLHGGEAFPEPPL